jgi:hypothetical protein
MVTRLVSLVILRTISYAQTFSPALLFTVWGDRTCAWRLRVLFVESEKIKFNRLAIVVAVAIARRNVRGRHKGQRATG